MQNRKNSIFSSKKGNIVIEIITILIVVVVFGLITYIGYMAFDDVNADIQSDDNLSAEAKNISSSLFARYPATMDNGFLMVLILLWIFTLIAAYLVESHPAFFIVMIVLFIAVFIACMYLGNALETTLGETELSGISTHMPIIYWVFTHLLQTILAIAFSIALVLFAKTQYG